LSWIAGRARGWPWAALAAGAVTFSAMPAWADNCSSLSDCYDTARAALAAAVALGIFATLVSVGLDFVPGIGTAKGILEAITGKDLITGEELAWWERALGIVPLAGAADGAAATAVRRLDRAAEALDAGADLARGLGRAGDELSDAARAAGHVEVPKGGRGPIPRGTPDDFGTHVGSSSNRPFFPDEIGIPIEPRSTAGVNVTPDGIDAARGHLARFGPDAANEVMLDRLDNIAQGRLQATPADLNFYTHELRELERYEALGYPKGAPADANAAHRLWNNTHTATLEEYGLTDADLYHPSAFQ